MPIFEYYRGDPFRSETELLKQIALFQRKAAGVDQHASPHGAAMHSLYSAIVAHCRAELDGLHKNAAARDPGVRVSS